MRVTVSQNESLTRASIVFSHPTGNIITAGMVGQLRAALEDLHDARSLRLITIEGEGGDFSFGASIPEHGADQIANVLPEMHALIGDLITSPAPTAAVVRGRCLGGGFELALACDFIFAADDAVFGLPEIALGVFPPAASVLLPLRVGAARATSAVLTGATTAAADWVAAGLVHTLAPRDRLADVVDDWFDRTLGRWSAEALRHAVTAVRHPLVEAVGSRLPAIERLYLDDLMRSRDAIEGIQAFREKRAPRWTDR